MSALPRPASSWQTDSRTPPLRRYAGQLIAAIRAPRVDPRSATGGSGSDHSEEEGDERQKSASPRDCSDYEKTLVGGFLLSCHFQSLQNESLSANKRVSDQEAPER